MTEQLTRLRVPATRPPLVGPRRPALTAPVAPVVPIPPGAPRRTAVLARDELVRRGLLDVMWSRPHLEILPTVSDQRALRRIAEHGLAEVVVLDLAGADETAVGIAEARAVKRAHPDLVVVLLARDLEDEDVLAAVRGGIDALVSRTSRVDDLVAVIEQAVDGTPTLDRHFTIALVRALRFEGEVREVALTAREREVLSLVALGQRNLTVARALFISESTVKFHLRNISDKLGASSRAEVVSIAMRLGLA